MRIKRHPIVEFKKGRKVSFYFEGERLWGYEGETVAAALLANGIKLLHYSKRRGRPRGFFCAIGRCASCNMVIDGAPNRRACLTLLKEGMRIERQHGRGRLRF